MIVPLELANIAQRRGYLSPELALGWRIGDYVTEFFGDLENVRVAAKNDGDAALGLSIICRKTQFPFPVTIADGQRPWDFLVYHYSTGTVLEFIAVSERTSLPIEIQRIKNDFDDPDPIVAGCAIRYYGCALDQLIYNILSNPVDTYCRISESRIYFPLGRESGTQRQFRCRRCGRSLSESQLLDSDGVICCLVCAGMEPSWFEWT